MKVVVVPNELSDAINKKLDAAFDGITISVEEREAHFNTLLDFFDKHGALPEISIEKASND